MDAQPIALEILRDGGSTRMLVSGELDLVTAPWLERAVEEHLEAADDVVVDLTRARVGDSAPIDVLVRARNRAAHYGRRLDVVWRYWPLAS